MAPSYLRLSRRERQIMDIIYKRGQATVGEIMKTLPDPPSNSAVRSKLRVLEEKGYVSHVYHGPRYVYQPVVPRQKAEKSVLSHLLQTFFDGSALRRRAKTRRNLFERRRDSLRDHRSQARSDYRKRARLQLRHRQAPAGAQSG